MDIWKLPDILVLQLKRFKYTNHSISKINNLVDFPITDLDAQQLMKGFEKVAGLTASTALNNCRYDLYGVVNHLGTASGGHYTSYGINLSDSQWYYFDDEYVRPV